MILDRRFITLLVVVMLAAEVTPSQSEMIRQCGSMLANTLDGICQGLYNGKRSDIIPYPFGHIEDPEYIDEPMFPLVLKKRVSTLLIPRRGRRQYHLAQECCLKSCSLDELRGYCAS